MRYAIGVGSNRGDRDAVIAAAERELAPDIVLLARSRFSDTAPVGGSGGPYRNGAWLIETGFGPHQLLRRLQAIETALGRTRTVRWGPRTLDLDLLLREDGLRVANPVLTLPHPRLHLRRFVLEPLAELVPGWMHPLTGTTIAALAG